MSQLSRRTVLLGGTGALLAGCGSAGEPSGSPGEDRALQGRGSAAGRLMSEAMGGALVDWTLTAPADTALDGLPVVVALHGRGGDHTTGLRKLELVEALDALVAEGGTPFALATVAGGDHSYFHRRADGTDAGAMIRDELVPGFTQHGVDLGRVGLCGWSMGGYGALLLAGKGEMAVRAVAVASPALFTSAGSTPAGAFDSAEDFAEHDVYGHPEWLRGVPVRIDCGEEDPFYAASRDFAARLDPPAETGFGPGKHEAAYWRTVAPAGLGFLGEHLDG